MIAWIALALTLPIWAVIIGAVYYFWQLKRRQARMLAAVLAQGNVYASGNQAPSTTAPGPANRS